MNYRLLLPSEWDMLKDLMPSQPLPDPAYSAVAVCEDSIGALVGCLVLQLQWHMEPLVIQNPQVSFLRLKEVLDEQLKSHPGVSYYAFADTEQVAKMAELAGLQPLPYLTFKGGV